MTCEYFSDGRCVLAELLLHRETGASVPCVTSEKRCGECKARGVATEDSPTSHVLANAQVACPRKHKKEWQAYRDFVTRGVPRGLGDRIAKLTKKTGIDRAVKAVAKVVGKDCGCAKRQKRWNEKFPSQSPTKNDTASTQEKPG